MRPYRRPPHLQRPQGKLNHRAWRRLRDQVVREEPLCRLRLPGCTLVSTTGDHIIPVSFRPDLRFVRSNVRGSCRTCNGNRSNQPLEAVRARMTRSHPPAKALGFFR